jgi:hypothetical protein
MMYEAALSDWNNTLKSIIEFNIQIKNQIEKEKLGKDHQVCTLPHM